MAFLRKNGFALAPASNGGDADPRADDPSRYLTKVEPGRWVGMLWRRGWIPLLTTVLAVAAMVLYLRHAPKYYRSFGSVYVSAQAPQVLDIQAVSPVESRDLEQLRSVEQSLVSSTLLLRVIAANHLGEAPDFAQGATSEQALLGILSGRIKVELQRGTRDIGIAVEDTDPARAKRLVESIISEYERWATERQESVTLQASSGLRTAVSKLEEKMESSTRALQDFREKNPVPGLDAKEGGGVMQDVLSGLNAQLATVRGERVGLEAQLEAFRKFDPSDPDALAGVTSGSQLDELKSLARALQDKETEFARVKERYQYKHPVYIEVANEIARLKQTLGERARLAGEALEKSYQIAKDKEGKLFAQLDAARGQAVEFEGARAEFARLRSEAEADRDMHTTVAKRLRETSLEGAVPTSVLSWRDVPLVPEKPNKPSKAVMLPLATAGGMFLGLVLMLAGELGDTRVRDTAAAARATGVPLLTTVPQAERDAAGGMVLLTAPASPVAEAFRRLRSVLTPTAGGTPRTVMFTSAVAGEGRSLCAMNYAASLAMQGHRTLLLDADLRRPGLSREHLMAGGEGRGLGDYLAGQTDPAKTCFPTALPNLYLLSSGTMRHDAAELLAGTRLPALLEDAYRWFDAVVIDTPPVLAVSDALAVARYADRTCLVVRERASDRRELRKAADLVRSAGGNLIGFIWNEMPLRPRAEPFPEPSMPVIQPALPGSGVTVSGGGGVASHGAESGSNPQIA